MITMQYENVAHMRAELLALLASAPIHTAPGAGPALADAQQALESVQGELGKLRALLAEKEREILSLQGAAVDPVEASWREEAKKLEGEKQALMVCLGEARDEAAALREKLEDKPKRRSKAAAAIEGGVAPPVPANATIGWPAGVTREEYRSWKDAEAAKGQTENLNPQEYKRLRDVGQFEGGFTTPAPRGAEPAEQDHAAELAHIARVTEAPGSQPVPDSFLALPVLEKIEVGMGVVICYEDPKAPTGWRTPGAIVERNFEGSPRWECKIIQGGYMTVHADMMRDVAPVGPTRDYLEEALQRTIADQQAAKAAPPAVHPMDDPAIPEGREIYDPAKHQLPTFILETGEAQPDRLLLQNEREDLVARSRELKLEGPRVAALIEKHFAPKRNSGELTVTELPRLWELMESEARIPW